MEPYCKRRTVSVAFTCIFHAYETLSQRKGKEGEENYIVRSFTMCMLQ